MRALVLSGGGARGAYEAGVVAALIGDCKEDFDIVCGTSIGAINASLVAQGNASELTAVWRSVSQAHIADPLPVVQSLETLYANLVKALNARGLFQKAGDYLKVSGEIRKLPPLDDLEKITGALDPSGIQRLLQTHLDFASLRKILLTTATDFTTSRGDVFYAFPQAYGDKQKAFLAQSPAALPLASTIFIDVVRASAAIPAAFSPVEVNVGGESRSYLDGGITNNTPIGLAINAGADDVTIVYVDPKQTQPASQSTANLVEILMGCFAVMQQSILELDYAAALQVNKVVNAGGAGAENKRIVKIRKFYPDAVLPAGIIDFNDQSAIDKTFAIGQNDARSAKRQNYQT